VSLDFRAPLKMFQEIKFTEIPKYPEVRRDLALLIDHNVTYDSIYSIAKQTEKTS
jgi:phenylalanyl-tRNA synthetase beta chain